MAKLISFFLSLTLFLTSFFCRGGFDARKSEALSQNAFAAAGYRLTSLLIDDCYDPLRHAFHRATDSEDTPYVWPATSLVEAMADAYRLFPGSAKLRVAYADALKRGLKRYLATEETFTFPTGTAENVSYYNPWPGTSGDYYFDDNAWVCIQLLFGYENLGDKSLLEAAETNLRFLWLGWDDALGGGVYWAGNYATKNACSNAPVAIAHLLAYKITGNGTYLTRARMIYDWVNATLRQNDLIRDAIGLNGNVDGWCGTYNQATMIYAGSLLYELTGEERYYDLTRAAVDATLPHLFEFTETETGETAVKMRANPIFKAWCVGWLVRSYVKFYEVDPARDTAPMDACRAVLRDTLETKDENGLYDPYFCSDGADPENYTDLLSQAGVAASLLCAAYYEALNAER